MIRPVRPKGHHIRTVQKTSWYPVEILLYKQDKVAPLVTDPPERNFLHHHILKLIRGVPSFDSEIFIAAKTTRAALNNAAT